MQPGDLVFPPRWKVIDDQLASKPRTSRQPGCRTNCRCRYRYFPDGMPVSVALPRPLQPERSVVFYVTQSGVRRHGFFFFFFFFSFFLFSSALTRFFHQPFGLPTRYRSRDLFDLFRTKHAPVSLACSRDVS